MRGLVVVALVAVAGCGPNGAANNSAAPVATTAAAQSTACDILTAADAARALGRPVEKLAATGGAANLDICQYGYQGERLVEMGHASVTLHANSIAEMKAGVVREGYDAEEIGGLGDEAFWSHQAGLYVAKGGRTAVFIVGAGDIKDAKAPTLALAQATVERL